MRQVKIAILFNVFYVLWRNIYVDAYVYNNH